MRMAKAGSYYSTRKTLVENPQNTTQNHCPIIAVEKDLLLCTDILISAVVDIPSMELNYAIYSHTVSEYDKYKIRNWSKSQH